MATKIVILLGPTCVGKTAYGIRLAQQMHSPVISCDSRQVYKEMNIGVARPTALELAAVKHYFIASHSIEEPFSAGEFERLAWELVEKLAPDHEQLLIVGGSGLYIDAFCDGMANFPDTDPELRRELTECVYSEGGLETMRAQLRKVDPHTYSQIDLTNKQRVLRALEVYLLSGKPYSSFLNQEKKKRPYEIIKIGLDRPREELYQRIDLRVDEMMRQGLEQEARGLYPFRDRQALQTVGYREIFESFDGAYPLEEAVRRIKRNTRHYAKRQLTYWRRDKNIMWRNPS